MKIRIKFKKPIDIKSGLAVYYFDFLQDGVERIYFAMAMNAENARKQTIEAHKGKLEWKRIGRIPLLYYFIGVLPMFEIIEA